MVGLALLGPPYKLRNMVGLVLLGPTYKIGPRYKFPTLRILPFRVAPTASSAS